MQIQKLSPENAIDSMRAMLAGDVRFTGAEIVICSNKSLRLEAQDGGLESYRNFESIGVGLRLAHGSRIAQSYTSQLEMAELKALVTRCASMLEFAPEEPGAALAPIEFSGDPGLGSKMVDTTFELVASEEKINRVLNLEANVLKVDPRIKRTRGTQYRESHSKEWLWTLGSHKTLFSQKTVGALSTSAVAEVDGDSQIGYEGLSETHYYDLDWGLVAKNAAQMAVKLLKARPLKTGRYSVLIPNYLATQLLSVLASAFSGENVAQKLSFLSPSQFGKEIFSREIHLLDDPHQGKRVGTAYWDAEGTPTRRLPLINAGRLESFAHNKKSARMLNTKSTGNAVRGSERLAPSIGFHNLMIEPGKKDFVDLLRDLNTGLLLSKISGLHSANPVTGEFSVGITGNWIESGENPESAQNGVNNMTLSGSLLEVMSKVEAIGRDLRWSGSYGSPSLLCRDLTLSGS